MKLTNEFDPIRQWAFDKGILSNGDKKTQALKLQEEAGELAKAVIENNQVEVVDAIGDIAVVLTSLAHFFGVSIELCINSAYKEIANRKGKMADGTFIREK